MKTSNRMAGIRSIVHEWFEQRRQIRRYCTSSRIPFFELAASFIPAGSVLVVDVGCGTSDFGRIATAQNPMCKILLLDSNSDTVSLRRGNGEKTELYTAPARLPLDNSSAGMVHCSHMLEHLQPPDVYDMMREFRRVLQVGGILAISGPLMWDGFYDDLSHVRPYTHIVFDKYLIGCSSGQSYTRENIGGFRRSVLQYRYGRRSLVKTADTRSVFLLLDAILLSIDVVLKGISIVRVQKTGFTVIYERVP